MIFQNLLAQNQDKLGPMVFFKNNFIIIIIFAFLKVKKYFFSIFSTTVYNFTWIGPYSRAIKTQPGMYTSNLVRSGPARIVWAFPQALYLDDLMAFIQWGEK